MCKASRFDTPELLDGLRRRDRQAWEAFYEEQWGPLCRFIRARLHEYANGQADSEDLTQEAFCRAYAGIDRFRGEARLGTWLRSIAQHVIVDAARAANLRQRLHEGNGALESMRENLHARDMPAPEASTVRKDILGKALQELRAVLGTHSLLFTRRHLEELSEAELAEAEGTKRGTVSAYLSRARARLRQHRTRFTALE